MADNPPPLTGITAHLTVVGAAAAADFYARAFGARELFRMASDDQTRLLICRLELNDGTLLLSDDFPEYRGGTPTVASEAHPSPVTLHLQVTDCDRAYAQAIDCGATPLMPPADMFWGDRYAQVRDPFGHRWSLAHTITPP